MRIISGSARGTKLELKKDENTRPTTDRVKEALFNIIQFELVGKTFLDLFGGTGQIGIEAHSRGAEEVIIVENQKANFNIIKKNLAKIRSPENIKIIYSDALNFLNKFDKKIDIAFLDPPYKSDLLDKILPKTAKIMDKNGVIITETSSSEKILNEFQEFTLQKRYKYGNISLNLYIIKQA